MTTVAVTVYVTCQQCQATHIRDGYVTYHRATDSYEVGCSDPVHRCEWCGGTELTIGTEE